MIANQVAGLFGSPYTAPPVTVGDYDSIVTVSGTGASGTITFSSIPSTYKHLQIRMLARSSGSYTSQNIGINFNADSGANYAFHYLYGDGINPGAGGASSQTLGLAGRQSGSSATANIYSVSLCDILDYKNTSKYKTIRSLGGEDLNGSGLVIMQSSLWQNTNAITSITLTANGGGNFTTASSFSLYGVK